jgi:hypothetical protein
MVLGAIAYFGLRKVEPPQLYLVMPSHAKEGDVVILSGAGFALRPEENLVFVGDYAARVLEALPSRLLVEIPSMSLDAGERQSVPVRVQIGRTQSQHVEMTIDHGEPEPGEDAPTDDDDRPSPSPRTSAALSPSPR